MTSRSSTPADMLAPEKRELYRLLLQKRGIVGANVDAIARRAAPGPCPLSFAQQRLWFLDQLTPGNAAYHLPMIVQLSGTLDVAALEQALAVVVERHEALRTTFPTVDGQPVQQIAATGSIPLIQCELRALPAPLRDTAVQQQFAAAIDAPFDLAAGPLLRASILRRADDEHILLLVLHHIVGDAWSLQVLVRELLAAYKVAQGDAAAALPPLPIQYADFAIWQRQWLDEPAAGGRSPFQRQLAYWQEQLAGVPTALDLPTDYPRPQVQTFRGAQERVELEASLQDALQLLSREAEATLFMTLVGAFQVLLARYTGQDAIVVGTGIAGRTRRDLEPLIGFFVNTLVLHTDLSGNPSFREVLARVRTVCLGAYAHQDLPFERLVDALHAARDTSRTPLFQAVFLFQSAQPQAIELPGLIARPLEAPSTSAKFDLTLALEETANGLIGAFEYNADLFAPATVQLLAQHFAALLGSLAADPNQRIRQIPLFAAEIAAQAGVAPARVTQLAPLTTTQRDLYLDALIHPTSTTYSLGVAIDLGVDLDYARWERAARATLAQTDLARTRFGRYRDELVQWVDREAPGHFACIDLSADSRSDAVASTIQGLSKRPYDLGAAPLLHSYLIRTPDEHYVALMAAPHILLDAASAALLFQRIGEVYLALGQGQNAAPALRSSFAAYIGQHLAQFDTPDVRRHWAERLGQLVPLDLYPPEQRQDRPLTSTLQIAGRQLEALRAYCAANACSIAAYFRALYSILIQRYADAPGDFVLYDIRGGRTKEHQQTLGCLYHVLPIILPPALFRPAATIAEYLAYLRDYRATLDARQYVSVFLQRSLMQQEPLRFFYNCYDFAVSEVAGRRGVIQVYDSFPADEVHLIVLDAGDTIELVLHYNQKHFAELRFLERLAAIAEQAPRATTLDDLDILLDDERRQLQNSWSAAAPPPATGTLHGHFEAQAARAPDAVAVVYGETSLTYGALNRRACQLAHELRSQGVGPEVLVGLYLERSPELIVGLLGILKAGGAYVPLEPASPPERLALILADTRAPLVLTQQALAGQLPGYAGSVLCLDADWPRISEMPHGDPIDGAGATNPAYVIYTSGSTGQPKGSVIGHAQVLRLFTATQDWFGFSADDAWSLFHSYAFDFSVWEIWGALLYGGRLVLVPYWVSRSAEDFYTLLCRQQITILNQTPSAFRQLIAVEAARATQSLALRLVIFGGEALDFQSLAPWLARHGDQVPQLVNMYGITETTVHVTYRPVRAADLGRPTGSLIGRPLPDLRLAIVDRRLRPVPFGLPGELIVGGAGLARGYLNRPELTAERFIPNPFTTNDERRTTNDHRTGTTNAHRTGTIYRAPTGGQGDKESGQSLISNLQSPDSGEAQHSTLNTQHSRLYRTGDLARYCADGDLEYLGRIDQQVKIRGFRIELSEIETVLAQHPQVQAAVVLAHEDSPGEKRLVAYITPNDKRQTINDEAPIVPSLAFSLQPSALVGELRAFLKPKLPEYMIPAVFVQLEALPLTPNGKVDRRALLAPDRRRPELATTFAAPRTPTEEQLALLWARLLGVERVGIHDNFFELGGHSLLATQLVSQLRSAFQVELPLQRIFEMPTVAELAEYIDMARIVGRELQIPVAGAGREEGEI